MVPHFTGRMTRRRFWAGTVMYFVVSSFLGMLWSTLFMQTMSERSWNLVDSTLVALGVYLSVVLVSFAVRRLHDINHSGLWAIVTLLPGIGTIAYIVIGCMASTPGSNAYGPSPEANVPLSDNEALESLARLRASGLMTEEEYRRKVEALTIGRTAK